MSYDGAYYAQIGDFLGEGYLNYDFTRGTVQEVDFLVELLHLPRGARILDVGCGPGRHSLELARRGFNPVGVDISTAFIDLARRAAQRENLPAEFLLADARRLTFSDEFDAAICLCEGAFGLAGDEDGQRAVLASIHHALKPEAPLALSAINVLCPAMRSGPGVTFDPYTSTIQQHTTLRNPAGEKWETDLYTTAFTFRELKWLMESVGLDVETGYGCRPGAFLRRPLESDDPEILLLARRL